nr:FGGY carbohydrate kinase domain-containing protein [Ipomoea batatas]
MATATSLPRSVFLGVDVGSGSARAGTLFRLASDTCAFSCAVDSECCPQNSQLQEIASQGLFDEDGKLLGSASSPIQIWKSGDFVEQSSTDIWLAVCTAVKAACSLANVTGNDVKGLGFAATCSLVAVDSDGEPVTVSWSGDARRNIIVWMDHRAVKQAERINSSNSPVLQYCGGAVSPEMQPPKLLWVKENLQESWSMAFRWMDLSDWLSYRATGDDTRSLCTTVCKWTYLGHAHMQQINEKDSRNMEACGWDDEFWEEIGLGDLVDGHHAKIGRSVAFPGHALGSGLTPKLQLFQELGLVAGIPVGTSLIDAHAGGVGVMESLPRSVIEPKEVDAEAICHRMVLVCGTSTCHMAVSRTKLFIPGVWGPYWSAMVPEYWLTEGGQSATGSLLDHVIENHLASPHLANLAASQSKYFKEFQCLPLQTLSQKPQYRPYSAGNMVHIHVMINFHFSLFSMASKHSDIIVICLTLDAWECILIFQILAGQLGSAYAALVCFLYPFLVCFIFLDGFLFLCLAIGIGNEQVMSSVAVLKDVLSSKVISLLLATKATRTIGFLIPPSSALDCRSFLNTKFNIWQSLHQTQTKHFALATNAFLIYKYYQ